MCRKQGLSIHIRSTRATRVLLRMPRLRSGHKLVDITPKSRSVEDAHCQSETDKNKYGNAHVIHVHMNITVSDITEYVPHELILILILGLGLQLRLVLFLQRLEVAIPLPVTAISPRHAIHLLTIACVAFTVACMVFYDSTDECVRVNV